MIAVERPVRKKCDKCGHTYDFTQKVWDALGAPVYHRGPKQKCGGVFVDIKT